MYAANIFKYDFVVKLIELGDDVYSASNNGNTLGYTITHFENKNKKNPNYRLPEELFDAKKLLIEKGIIFPALGLDEVLERRKKGLPIQ